MNDVPRPPPSKKMKRWRLELRKDLQQKRKRHFDQAEKEKEQNERTKRRKTFDSTKEERKRLLTGVLRSIIPY